MSNWGFHLLQSQKPESTLLVISNRCQTDTFISKISLRIVYHHYRSFSLVLSISFNLVRFVQTSRFTFIIINWRFFSGCKSCRPVVLKRLPSGIFPPHLQIRIRISNRNSCTSSFSKGGMLELETSRRFYFFYFSKDLLHTYLASLYTGHVAPSQIIIILRSKSNRLWARLDALTRKHLKQFNKSKTRFNNHV